MVPLALMACEGNSSSKSDQPKFTADDGMATSTTALGRPAEAPQVGAAVGVAEPARRDAAQLMGLSEQAANTDAGSRDPLQFVTPGTVAPAMVIRTGQAFIEVEKVDDAVMKVRQLAAQVGGYIANSSISGGRDQTRQATFELKIPSTNYDRAVGSLSTIGKVETVASNAQDVGEEFVDITARVTNARRLEERLISLLANRTGKLDEVLRVERELARVREEIERYEGRLRYLSSRVALSTLSITVHEPSPILGNNPGENPIAAALRRAWRNFVALLAGLIASLGVLIPLALIGAAGWYAYKRWRQRQN
jgi:hypothetical protein